MKYINLSYNYRGASGDILVYELDKDAIFNFNNDDVEFILIKLKDNYFFESIKEVLFNLGYKNVCDSDACRGNVEYIYLNINQGKIFYFYLENHIDELLYRFSNHKKSKSEGEGNLYLIEDGLFMEYNNYYLNKYL